MKVKTAEKIWLYHRDMLDCGAIALGSRGRLAAKKVASASGTESSYLVLFQAVESRTDDEAATGGCKLRSARL